LGLVLRDDGSMAKRQGKSAMRPGASLALGVAVVGALAGCGSKAGAPVDAGPHDADFSQCIKADAAPYMAGAMTPSRSGTYLATIVSATTTSTDSPTVDAPGVGLSTFAVTIADTNGGAPVGMTVTAEKPYMPLHGHGADTFPTVTDQGGGMFSVDAIHFIMAGYWEVTLDLKITPPEAGAPEAGGESDAGAGDADGGDDAAPDATTTTPPPPPKTTTDKIVLPICIPA
jgi:hypothetical protein